MTTYDEEWQRQLTRDDVPVGDLPVHRWYLRLDAPSAVAKAVPPRDGLTLIRAENPGIRFYRFLYHTAGEEFLWGDRRQMSDEELLPLVNDRDVHVMVLYERGTPAGFYELSYQRTDESHIKYFALLPGFIGGGLGSYMLTCAINHAGERERPLILDTCTLDHPSALENYRKRGFVVYAEEDLIYPDPRLDGTVPPNSGKHVPSLR